MAIEGITLEEEYRYMENEFGLTSEQKKIILNNAVDAAFTSAAVKEELKKELGLAK
jgi:adenosine deaminase